MIQLILIALYTENDKRLLRNELHIGETDFVFIRMSGDWLKIKESTTDDMI